MPLVVTPGSGLADSYASLVEAASYDAAYRGGIFDTVWTAATDAKREAALRTAAHLLDASFVWTGVAIDAIQALAWPRSGMLSRNGFAITEGVIPQDLKNAQAEFARQLLAADRAADDDVARMNLQSLGVGSVSLSFKKADTDANALALRSQAFAYLSNVVPDAVKSWLVPSWFVAPLLSEVVQRYAEFDVIP